LQLMLTPLVPCTVDSDCATASALDGNDSGRCCAHRCVDSHNDAQNCGACDVVCSSANGTPRCDVGQCAWSCAPGFGHCGEGNGGCEAGLGPAGLRGCGGAVCVPAGSCCDDADCASPPSPAACYQAGVCSGVGGSCSYTAHPGAIRCGSTCCRPLGGTC